MKVLDIERKGNVVRFYLGDDALEKWWGDNVFKTVANHYGWELS